MSRVYPAWWNNTLTVYNRYEDKQTHVISWYRTVLHNCFWKFAGDKVTIGETVIETDAVICRIPESDKFLTRENWEAKPNDVMGQYFTISPGDIIIQGEVTDIVNEYLAGHRSSDLMSKYNKLARCLQVKVVRIDTYATLTNPHYFIKGV